MFCRKFLRSVSRAHFLSLAIAFRGHGKNEHYIKKDEVAVRDAKICVKHYSNIILFVPKLILETSTVYLFEYISKHKKYILNMSYYSK